MIFRLILSFVACTLHNFLTSSHYRHHPIGHINVSKNYFDWYRFHNLTSLLKVYRSIFAATYYLLRKDYIMIVRWLQMDYCRYTTLIFFILQMDYCRWLHNILLYFLQKNVVILLRNINHTAQRYRGISFIHIKKLLIYITYL